MKRLTETQENLLQFVRGRINQGAAPSRREICEKFGWTSPTSAEQALKALENKGFIRLGHDKHRAISVVKSQEVFRDAALWDQWKILISVTKSLAGNHS